MPRHPKPWYRRAADAWYVQVDGKQILLASGRDNQSQAWAAFHRLRTGGAAEAEPVPWTVADLCELYLEHSQAVHRPATYATNVPRLRRACVVLGAIRIEQLALSDVERWAASLDVSTETRRDYLVTLRAALEWTRNEGYHSCRPLMRLRLPPRTRRERTLSPAEREAIREAASPALRDVLLVLEQTGCRPMVAAEIEARHCDWGASTATLTSKGRPYVLILTDRLAARLRELAVAHPEGALLRNGHGSPWTRNAIRCAFRRLRTKLGLVGVSAYTYRHSFATDALERGVNPAALAVLLNHADLTMISRHYSHLAERRDALRTAAEAAAAPPAPPSGRIAARPPRDSRGSRRDGTARRRGPE